MGEAITRDIIATQVEDFIKKLEDTVSTIEDKQFRSSVNDIVTSLRKFEEQITKEFWKKPQEIFQEFKPYWSIEKRKVFTRIVCDLKLPHRTMDKVEYANYRNQIEDEVNAHFRRDKHMKECYLVFVHHHKNNICKDADNFEEKPLSDMIAKLFIIGGDGNENVQRMSLTQKDDYDFTEIFLVPRTNFIEFWSEFYPQNTW